MSGSGPRREVAYRIFGAEFNDAEYTYAESDEERAPNYLVTPTGARVNRLFVVGVLTEIEEVSDDVLRARVVDPTGAFVIYAGQYQPDALAFFERAEPPIFVALTGKARTFQPDGSDRVFTSIRPETVNEVDADTRDRWVVQTAEHTLERIALFAKVLGRPERGEELKGLLRSAGVQPGLAEGIPRAIEEYGTTTGYLASMEQLAVDATRLVAGEVDAVERDEIAPSEGGEDDVDTSLAGDISLPTAESPETAAEPETSAEAEELATAEEPEVAEEGEVPEEPDVEEEAEEPEEPEMTEERGQPEVAEAAEESDEAEVAKAPDESVPAADLDEQSSKEPPAAETDGVEPAAEEEVEETDEMYELSEEERAEVEENYDVGFESGAEIGSPESTEEVSAGEPGAEGPSETADEVEPEEGTESAEAEAPDGTAEGETEPETETVTEAETGEEATDATDLSEGELEDVVIETMEAEAGDDGIPKPTLIDHVQSEYDVDETAIEEAIQDALLGGRCFESGDDRLKPI